MLREGNGPIKTYEPDTGNAIGEVLVILPNGESEATSLLYQAGYLTHTVHTSSDASMVVEGSLDAIVIPGDPCWADPHDFAGIFQGLDKGKPRILVSEGASSYRVVFSSLGVRFETYSDQESLLEKLKQK